MNKIYRNFLIKNILVTLIIAFIGLILFKFFLIDLYHPLYLILLLVAFSVNIVSFYLSSNPKSYGRKALSGIIQSFALRFFLYLGLALLYLLNEDRTKHRIVFIISLFCLYLIYSIIEISCMKQLFKNKSIE